MNLSFFILVCFLIAGLIFILLPNKFQFPFVDVKSAELDTKKIRAIILFVSFRKENEPLESLLAYKILSQLAEGKGKKRVWLFHSMEFSSKPDADAIYSKFNVHENLQISQHLINDVNHITEPYEKVSTLVYSDKSLDIRPSQICCECTSGTKPVTLGFALASLGRGKLIYFPMPKYKEAHKYVIINASTPRIADVEP